MNDYIVEEPDGFYYWDETSELIGPFKTLEQCEVALDAYLKWVAKDNRPKIKKMREDMGL
jgi:hypothetical protein